MVFSFSLQTENLKLIPLSRVCAPAFKGWSSLANSIYLGRIHFSLHYPDLTEDSRKNVWSNFIDTVAKQSGNAVLSLDDIAKLAKLDLNGRQVRVAFPFLYS